MQNLKYLERVVDEEIRFGVSLNELGLKHQDHIQFKMALSLLEYFNQGKFISEADIEKKDNIFYVSKEKYFKPKTPLKSKVFSIRINLNDSNDEIDVKISELKQKITRYRNLK